MSAKTLVTDNTRDAWLVHDGPGGRVYSIFETEADALKALRFYDGPYARAEIKRLPLKVVIDEADRGPRATITPAPKGKLTRKWKAHVILGSIWFASAVTSLFLNADEPPYKLAHAIAYTSVVILVLFVLRPPVQYQEATK